MICYIILHYMVLEETVNCVKSIVEKGTDNVKIIIVDNFSPNGSGKELEELYRDNDLVDVILHDENIGFARGNNIGYVYAKEKYNPDFMIIMNNDVEIATDNFYEELKNCFEKEQFHVLSPDIYSTTYGVHQSPKRLATYTYDEVKKRNDRYAKAKEETLALKIRCWMKASKFLSQFVHKQREKEKSIDFTKNYYNVPLHGSCVIVSRLFIEQEELAFHPGTFFYYEMEILDYICSKKGYKTMYYPQLKVLHHQNASTNVVYDNILKKTLFANKCNYESTNVFLQVMETYEKAKG